MEITGHIAARMGSIVESPATAISSRIRELRALGLDVINLGEGELDFRTPDDICEAGIEAIRKGETKYTAVSGTDDLKQAIRGKFLRDNGLSYEMPEVIASSGAKQLIFNALFSTISLGDEVVIPAPFWLAYPDMVTLCEGVPVIIQCDSANNWKLTPSLLRSAMTGRTKWVIINSPNNPTGSIYSKQELEEIGSVLNDFPNTMVMSDEIYELIDYTSSFVSTCAALPELKKRTLTVNGVSKSYSMTGWRLGFAGGPKWLISAIAAIQSQTSGNPCTISQKSAAFALQNQHDSIEEWISILKSRRDILVAALQHVEGLHAVGPDGAFFVLVNVSNLLGLSTKQGYTVKDDVLFAKYLLDVARVAVISGTAFGAPGHIRISYAVSTPTLQEACLRVAQACSLLRE